MRKLYCLIALAALLSVSCAGDPSNGQLPEKAPADARTTLIVTLDEARLEVLSLLNDVDPLTRSGQPRRSIKNSFTSGGFGPTRAEGGEDEPVVHVFNFEDDLGFAIVAGDARVSPILALTESGNIDPDDVGDNPGFLLYLTELDTYYRLCVGLPVTDEDGNVVTAEEYGYDAAANRDFPPLIPLPDPDGPIKPSDPYDPTLPPTYSYTYGPWTNVETLGTIMPCTWDQGVPFNDYCFTSDGQQAFTGCVAIAVGQIMYHWGKSATYGGIHYNWNVMRQIIDAGTDEIANVEAWELVGQLMRALGLPWNLNMDYGAAEDSLGSGASDFGVPGTFRNFGYVSGGSTQDYNFTTLKSVIGSRPVFGAGYPYKRVIVFDRFLGIKIWPDDVSYHRGHAWVFDQVLTRKREVKVYKNGIYDYSYYQTQELVHINWGWNGDRNGYYLSTRFDAGEGAGPITRAETYWYGTAGYYQYKLKMNVGIYP